MTGVEITLLVAVAYLLAGAMKITQDFNSSPIDKPFYVLRPEPALTLFAWMFWWRRQSLLFVAVIWAACAAVVWCASWVLQFLSTAYVVRYGLPMVLVIWSVVPLLTKKHSKT